MPETSSSASSNSGTGATTPERQARFASARDFVYVLFKYRVLILTVFLTTSVTVYAALSAISNKYEAQSTLLVQVGQENAGVPVTVVDKAFIQGGVKPEQVNSEIAALTSEALVRKTVEDIGYDVFLAEPPPPETLVQWARYLVKGAYKAVRRGCDEVLYALALKTRLSDEQAVIAVVEGQLVANPVKSSDALQVAFRSPSGWLAAEFVNKLVENHLRRRTFYLGEAGATQMFVEALALRKKELEEAEAALAAFRGESGISAMEEQRRIALERGRELDARIDDAEAAVARNQAEVAGLRASLARLPEGIASELTKSDPVGKELAESLATLYQRRARMASQYRPESRFMRELEDEIGAVRAQMGAENVGDYGSTTTAVNPNRQALERQIIITEAARDGSLAELEALRADRDRNDVRVRQLDVDEAHYRRLERERALAEQSLLTLSRKIEEARILEQMRNAQLTNLVVLSPATPPSEPAAPRRLLIMGAGLAGGLLGGLALAFAGDAVDRSVRYGRDLERIGIPLLASVPLRAGPLAPTKSLFLSRR